MRSYSSRTNNNLSSRTLLLKLVTGAAILGLLSSHSSSATSVAEAFQAPSPLLSQSSKTTRLNVSGTTPPPRKSLFHSQQEDALLSTFSSIAAPPSTADFSVSPSSYQEQQQVETSSNEEEDEGVLKSFLLPVLSSACLITGTTFGAGSLVMPELAQGPGLASTSALFVGAYIMNLISGLCIAQVAIAQKEKMEKDGSTEEVPCSFKEFVQVSTGSQTLATFISTVSFSVNSLVWAFVLSRVGVLAEQISHGAVASGVASTAWAAALVGVFSTQTQGKISQSASVCVAALFASFGSLLLPGLAAVPDDFMTVLSQPGLDSVNGGALASSVAQLAPVVYMSCIYQNIVPTVAKLQDYNPTRTLASIGLGSAIPLVMYLSWCYACLGGGIDLQGLTNGVDGGMASTLLTVFSLATLAGSSIGCGLSCASEIDTFFKGTLDGDNAEKQTQKSSSADDDSDRFRLPTVLASVGLPLTICHVFGQGGDLTSALSVAGGLGSPLLYGIIPVVMAMKQKEQQQREAATASNDFDTFMPAFLRKNAENDLARQMAASTSRTFVPASSLGLLGVFSTGMLGSELVGQATSLFNAATTAVVAAPVTVAAEEAGEVALAAMAPLV